MLNATVQFRINELGEEISRKHRFDEPNDSAPSHLAEAESRRTALQVQLPAQPGGRDVLVFG